MSTVRVTRQRLIMPQTDSPLRYPGGKSQLAPLVTDILRENKLLYATYVEVFAGGAGIAWKLLLNNLVSRVVINDLDRSIYAFWWAVLFRTDELCERISSVRVTRTQWRKQKEVQANRHATLLDLGYSTLFLNRTNRSGIIDGGIIGGKNQTGDYLIDCRFNKDTLIRKVQRIGLHREQVRLYRMDALKFLRTVLPPMQGPALVNLDPPYYVKGPGLYQNHYAAKDHEALAHAVGHIRQHWMVTYDDTPETRHLYARFPSYRQELQYTAQVKRVGVELLVLDPRLTPPSSLAGPGSCAA